MLTKIVAKIENAAQPREKSLPTGIHYQVPFDPLITILNDYLYERLANGSSLSNLTVTISGSFSRETMMNKLLTLRETREHNGSSHLLSFEVM